MRQKIIPSVILSLLIFINNDVISQSITSAIPTSAIVGQTIDIIIRGTGTHFRQGATTLDLGPGVNVFNNKVQVQNSLLLTASITVSSVANPGLRDIKVITGSEVASFNNGFEVYAVSGTLRATLEVLPVQSLSLGDLDPSNLTSAPFFFWVNIFNDNVPRNLKVQVSLRSAKIGQLGLAIDPTISLQPNQVIRLDKNAFTKYQNNPIATAFYKQVLATGSFPPDDYTYTVTVKDLKTLQTVSDSNVTTITNTKNNPELILPGALFTDPEQTVSIAQPLFQWFGQQDKYNFTLYQILPGQTAVEAVRNIPVYKTSGIQTNSFLYPAFAEKLIDGKEYAWQITSEISSIKGNQTLNSEVFRFIYKQIDSQINSNDNNGISSINVFPQQITLTSGQKFQFNANVLDAGNKAVLKAPVTWVISPTGDGTVDANGVLTAGNMSGTFALIAKSGNVSDFATVTINVVPKTTTPPIDSEEWLIDQMIKKVFGLP